MAENYTKILNDLRQFSKNELVAIFQRALNNVETSAETQSEKYACPKCSGKEVIRYGKKRGKQRYFCKSCHATFLPTTNTIMSMSHFGKEIWQEVFLDTIAGNSLSYSENRLCLSHQVVFNMRHKILIALQDISVEKPEKLGDVSELDETYVLDCYKGAKLPDNIDRNPRKHGAVAQKRGISNEYICLCTGVQRKSAAFVHAVNRARPSIEELTSVFSGHILDGAMLLTDGLKGYDSLEMIADCVVKNVEDEKASFYNLNTVNNLHSFIKRRYEFYRGVATKYINRYSALFSVAYRKNDKVISDIMDHLFKVGNTSYTHTIKQVKAYRLLNI